MNTTTEFTSAFTGDRNDLRRSVSVVAPGKVNLQLSIGGLRPDGFHEIVTIFQAVSLHDDIVARPANGLRLTVEGGNSTDMPLDGSNLAARAAEVLAVRAGIAPNVHLHIRKRVPIAGGMAGGSADAAAALVACSRLWDVRLPAEEILELAAELGSDVPFTLVGGTAIGTGRGERLRPVATAGIYHWVFAFDRAGLPTPRVYQEHDRLRSGGALADLAVSSDLLDALAVADTHQVGRALRNDAEGTVFSLRPELRRTLNAGLSAGVLGAVVAGTGPTCAFLVSDRQAGRELISLLAGMGFGGCYAYGPVTGPLGSGLADGW
ncbi:4-(cytidine 5'-diphospho)-2-C-methyl-D-erythritol kinase [Micromonospora sp. CA-244673]|uniref:4-(cytidine 5'-diphospho)-2-C-methyl-D-erythritol kinase n=1 Tax=Micromonospora sp. CA-244673 TaxID=3239958 RepID=UPI003D8D1664